MARATHQALVARIYDYVIDGYIGLELARGGNINRTSQAGLVARRWNAEQTILPWLEPTIMCLVSKNGHDLAKGDSTTIGPKLTDRLNQRSGVRQNHADISIHHVCFEQRWVLYSK